MDRGNFRDVSRSAGCRRYGMLLHGMCWHRLVFRPLSWTPIGSRPRFLQCPREDALLRPRKGRWRSLTRFHVGLILPLSRGTRLPGFPAPASSRISSDQSCIVREVVVLRSALKGRRRPHALRPDASVSARTTHGCDRSGSYGRWKGPRVLAHNGLQVPRSLTDASARDPARSPFYSLSARRPLYSG